MGKRQIAVRLLDSYVKDKKTSKTNVVIGSLAQYLDSPEKVPLGERMTALENRLTKVETRLQGIGSNN